MSKKSEALEKRNLAIAVARENIETVNRILKLAYLNENPSFNFEVRRTNLHLRTSIRDIVYDDLRNAVSNSNAIFEITARRRTTTYIRVDVLQLLTNCYKIIRDQTGGFESKNVSDDLINIALMSSL